MRRFLSGLLYLFLGLPVVLSGLLSLSVRPWAFDRGFYEKAIQDDRLWTALRSPGALKSVPDSVEIGGYLFSGPALYGAMQRRIPEAELKALGTKAVEDVIGSVESGKDAAPLDLRPLKSRIESEAPALVEDYLAAIPSGQAASSTDLRTRPAGLPPALLATEGTEALRNAVATIPDYAQPHVRVQNGALALGAGGMEAKAILDRVATTTGLAGAALLLGLGFLGGGGIGRSLARTGRYLILPSAIVLVAGTALALPGAPLVMQLASEHASKADPAFIKAVGGWLGSWLGVAARSFFVVGLSGLSIGGFLASIRRIVEPREY